MIWDLFILLALLPLSGLFSAAETAFTSLSLTQTRELAESGKRNGKYVERLMANPDILLTTLLLGNNLANVLISVLGAAITIRLFGSQFIGVASGVLTFVILIFGEIAPKQIALAKRSSVCLLTSGIILLLSRLFAPLCRLVAFLSSTVSRLFIREEVPQMVLENLLQMVRVGESLGIVTSYETNMVTNVFRVGATPIQGIMTHRREVFSLPISLSVGEAFPSIMASGFSRIPLYRATSDDIAGILLIKDLVRAFTQGEQKESLSSLMVEPLFFSHTKKVSTVFHSFKENNLNMGIVLDEYGGLAGVVTQEDIVELILGDLYDENEEKVVEKIRPSSQKGSWILEGDTSFSQIEDTLGIRLKHNSRVLSIGGHLIEKIGEIPEKGTSISLDEGTYDIVELSKNRIKMVRFTPDKPAKGTLSPI